MWNNGFSNYGQFGATMPTATQPYGYPTNNFGMQQPQPQPQQPMQTNTNKIYVSGIDDVRSRMLPQNSDYIFLDNDKPIIYQKIVDGKGQFEVKAFEIVPYSAQNQTKDNQSIDLSCYAKTSDLEPIKAELQSIKDRLMERDNGTGKENL